MTDKLVEVPLTDLPSLRNQYKVDWPQYNVGYGILDTYLRWYNQDPNVSDIKIYSLNGDWSDGTFIVTDRNLMFYNTLSKDFSRLERALRLCDYSKQYIISSVEARLIEMSKKFVIDQQLESLYNILAETKWYRMAASDALKLPLDVPDNILLRPLLEDEVGEANSLWPFHYTGSLTFLKRLTKYNINFGAFTKDGQLIAWCFRLPAGGLGTLQVVDAHKRKGYGSLLVRAMAKAISETGYDVFAPVVIDNYPSQKMFEKIGFKEINRMFWMPPSKNDTWDDD